MDIKDCIHYYIGCSCEVAQRGRGILSSVDEFGRSMAKLPEAKFCYVGANEVRPILRRLSDMTDGEALTVAQIYSGADRIKRTTGTVDNFFYFFCEFKLGYKGTNETLIIHNGEAWYQHYFEDMPRRRTGRRNIIRPFEVTHYLLKQGFDVFGLIDAGLAIDSKTLNK